MNFQKMESLRVKKACELFLDSASHVPVDKAQWKPDSNATSAQEIIQHLSEANDFFASMIKGETPPEPKQDNSLPFDQVLKAFKQSADNLVDTIASTPDEHLKDTREMPWGQTWKVQSILMSGSLHVSYHWGQIGYLQNAWGDRMDYHLKAEE